jgi:hypothetical protein
VRHRIPPQATVIALILCLLTAGVTLARWGGANNPLIADNTPQPTPTPGKFDPKNPSKEYIYAGGKLIATEEPGIAATPSPTPADSSSSPPSTESVVWRNAVGVIVAGSNLSKNTDWGWGNSGASSTKAISSGDGYVEYTVTDSYASISLLGLSDADWNQDYPEMDYVFHPAGSGSLYIYENGNQVCGTGTPSCSFGPYAPGDKLRVSVEGGKVRYRRNGVLLYTSAIPPTYPLLVDTAFYSPGAYVSDVKIAGTF